VTRSAPGITALLLALLITLLGATPAHAHATLLGTDPGPGAQLDAAPGEVRLTFSEPVTVAPGAVRLLRADQPAQSVSARTIDKVVVVRLPDLAQDARYTVAWRVVSADGHPISGVLAFSVGDAPPGPSVPGTDAAAPSPVLGVTQSVTTGIWYAGLFVVAGLLAFQVFCVRPIGAARSRETVRPDAGPARRRLLAIAAGAGGLAAVALVPVRTFVLADGLPAESAGVATLIGWQSPAAAVLSCVGLVAAVVLQRRERTGPALGAAALALASPTLTGHSAAGEPWWLMVAGDLVHLAAGAVWTGGVLGLVLYLRQTADSPAAGEDVPVAAQVVGRFSSLAGTTVFTAALAGVTMALLVLPDRGALTGTDYGRLLLLKLALVAMALALAGWNRFRLLPALLRPGGAANRWPALMRILRIEVAVLAAIVAVTGFLVNQSPTGADGDHTGHDHAGHRTGTAASPASLRGTGDQLVVTGTAIPVGNGSTQLRFSVTDSSGAPLQPVEPPSVTLTLPEQDLGPTRYEAQESPTGVHGTYLVDLDTPLPGRWQVLIGVRLSTFAQETVRVDVELG
jgi:copper transport protein